MPRAISIEEPIKPYWSTTDSKTVQLYLGNVTDVLARLPAKSVHMCVTSPPYWGLRDYGTAEIDPATGDPNCEHDFGRGNQDHKSKPVHGEGHKSPFRGTATGGSSYLEQGAMTSMNCRKCGAKRIDGQLGSEPSPDCKTDGQAQCGRCHVCNIVAVFRGVYRVLRDDGTIWVNYGDSYNANTGSGFNGNAKRPDVARETVVTNGLRNGGLKPGNLVGIPWRVALALQADGWVLRQDIIWHKPAPMPESVRNR